MKEYETLEDEIAQLELRKSNLIDKMNQGEGTHEDYRIWSEEVGGEIVRIIDQKTDRWLELSEIIERVE